MLRPKQNQVKKPSLWLGLYFFELPLAPFLIQNPNACVAIAEQQRLSFVADKAVAAGIEPRMSVATAYALLPEITIEQRDNELEIKTLRGLAEWCYQFTPQVSLYKEFALALEISSSLRLFKGLNNLFNLLEQGLSAQGHRYQWGLAHSCHGAWLLSQAPQYNLAISESYGESYGGIGTQVPTAKDFLSGIEQIPLSYLDVKPKQQQQLFNLGLHRIGDLLALPKASLGKRFGKTIIDLIDAIVGEHFPAQNTIEPADQYREQVDFANGLTRVDDIIHSLEQMLRRFCYFLHFHHYHTRLIIWRFYHFNLPRESIDVSTSPANNTLSSLLNLTRLKLDQYQFAAPIECVELVAENFVEASHRSQELFVDLSHPSNQLADYHFLLDKLINRLGGQTLFTLAIGDEHLPDNRQVLGEINPQTLAAIRFPETLVNETIADSPGSNHFGGNSPSSNTWEPLWLREQALPISYLYHHGPLRLVHGPQRVDSHWWQQRQQRDYFIARHQNGSCYWVFKDLSNNTWYLHGAFG